MDEDMVRKRTLQKCFWRGLMRGKRGNGAGIAWSFENKIHTALDRILYIVHTLLVTTYIISSPMIV